MKESEKIKSFFTPLRRQIMSVNEIERASGIPPGTLKHFLDERRGLPQHHEEAIVRIIEVFGYEAIGMKHRII